MAVALTRFASAYAWEWKKGRQPGWDWHASCGALPESAPNELRIRVAPRRHTNPGLNKPVGERQALWSFKRLERRRRRREEVWTQRTGGSKGSPRCRAAVLP